MIRRCTFVCFVLCCSCAFAQEPTTKDKVEIQSRAKLLVKELESLLNLIANVDVYQSEISEVIANSYTNSGNKLFENQDVIVENDLNPGQTSANDARDINVKAYLKNFDLFYSKSDKPSVTFSDIKISPISKGDYVFVKVYFKSIRTGRHRNFPEPYALIERIAEVKATLVEKKWRAQITSLIFYNPSVPFEESRAEPIFLAEAGSESNVGQFDLGEEKQDSLADAYQYIVGLANLSYEQKDYEKALQLYSNAQAISPYESHPVLMFQKIKAILSDRKPEDARNEAVAMGEKAQRLRDYFAAKQHYQKALDLAPGDENLKARIQVVDKALRSKEQLDSKFKTGDFRGALKDYRRASKADPLNPEYFFGMAKCLESLYQPAVPLKDSKEIKDAIRNYSKSLSLDINYIDALRARANLYNKLGNFPASIADYSGVISNLSSDSEAYKARAKVKAKINDLKGAISDYDKVTKLNYKDSITFYEKATSYYLLKEYDNARKVVDTLTSINPNYADAYFSRGLSYLRQQKIVSAASDFKRAIALGITNDKKYIIETESAVIYDLGINLRTKNDLKGAILRFNDALELHPAATRAYFARGKCFYDLKEFKSALNDFDSLIRYVPSFYEGYYHRGLTKMKLEQYPDARKDFLKAISLSTSSVKDAESKDKLRTTFLSFIGAGDAELMMQSYGPAIVLYKQAIAIQDTSATSFFNLGYSQYHLRDYPAAIQNFSSAIRLQKNFSKAYYYRGVASDRIGESDKGMEDIIRSISLGYDTYVEPYYEVASIYQKKSQHQKAITYYTHALKQNSEFAAGYLGRAISNFNIGSYSNTISDLIEFSKLDSDLEFKEMDFYMGISYINIGQVDKATSHFKRSVSFNETDSRLYLAICALKKKNIDESLVLFESAFKANKYEWRKIKENPLIDPILSNPKFKALIKQYVR